MFSCMIISMFNSILDRFNTKKNIKARPNVRDVRSDDDQAFLKQSKAHLEALEEIRQQKLKIYNRRKSIAVPVAAVITPVLGYIDYWLLFLRAVSDDGGAGLTVIALGALYAWVTSPKRQYAKAYKEKILPEIAKLFGDFAYDLKGRVEPAKMQPSRILPNHDRYKSEDYFSGTYKGVTVELSEIDLQTRHKDSKGRTSYRTVFKGLAILLDMKTKKFYGHTTLQRDRGKITEWFKEKTGNLKRANLVDPEFEKIFDVYTDDQVEARYLIDPLMIERLKGLQDEYHGEGITAAFYENKMLVLIQSKHNYFEPADLTVPAADPDSILAMKREVGEILSLIDRLSFYDPDAVHDSEMSSVEAS